MNYGSVYFKHTQNGWRVTFIRECKPDNILQGMARVSTFDNELVVTGWHNVKAGRFCKRPDRVIKVREVRK